jgi:hypothetical protein
MKRLKVVFWVVLNCIAIDIKLCSEAIEGNGPIAHTAPHFLNPGTRQT